MQWDDDTPWDAGFHREEQQQRALHDQQHDTRVDEQNAEEDEDVDEESQLLAPAFNDFAQSMEGQQQQQQHEQMSDSAHGATPRDQSPPEQPPRTQSSSSDSPVASAYSIEVSLSNHKTNTDNSSSPFTVYELQLTTNHPKLSSAAIWRRYSDFDFLYQCLSMDYPTLLIPPLPNKKRLEYVKGGRFTEEFITKRQSSLQLFMNRILNHPVLSKSDALLLFLSNDESQKWNAYKSNLNLTTPSSLIPSETPSSSAPIIDGLTDFIMNSFKKPHIESPNSSKFKSIHTQSKKINENLNKIDTIYSRLVSKQVSISNDLNQFSKELSKLGILFQNDLDGKHNGNSSNEFVENFNTFASNLDSTSIHFNELNQYIEFHYLNQLKDLEHYLSSYNSLLKLKDFKGIDYEELQSYLSKNESELTNLQNGGKIQSDTYLTYWAKKLSGSKDDIDLPGNEQRRIEKLQAKITMLKREVAKSQMVYSKYETDLLNEWNLFNAQKDDEILMGLNDLTQIYKHFYQVCQDDWSQIDPEGTKIPNIESQLPPSAEEQTPDDDLILKNQMDIESSFNKLGLNVSDEQ